ncbi:MAG: glycosyltransferase family 2 protein [Ignavibacteriae bacterium]|nr:glycosyltransferase family 2 protein [Ignavibacteriota bacterium]
MLNQIKIAAVVVTYNRLELLIECIGALRSQTRKLDEIIVVNNDSKDGTTQWLDEQQDITKIHQENLGGAGGFHNGMKLAYEKGYDWIWLMDDDAEPFADSLAKLEASIDLTFSALCSIVVDKDGLMVKNHRGKINTKYIKIYTLLAPLAKINNENKVSDIELATFVGILINVNAIKKIGLPRADFFIHNDDIEYCLRLLEFGKIKQITASKIIHKSEGDSELISINFLFKQIKRKPYHRYWVKYFTLRNFFIILLNYPEFKLSSYPSIFFTTIKEIIQIIFFDDNKRNRIKILILALKDSLKNNLNRKPLEIKQFLN